MTQRVWLGHQPGFQLTRRLIDCQARRASSDLSLKLATPANVVEANMDDLRVAFLEHPFVLPRARPTSFFFDEETTNGLALQLWRHQLRSTIYEGAVCENPC